jgi:Flp pilus assembly protein protease CpaA
MNSILSGILMDAFFIAILVWCSYTDFKKRTITNLTIVLLLCLGAAHMVLVIMSGGIWWEYPAGLLLAIPFFIAWLKNSMGGGDVKLIMAIAIYLGLWSTLVAFTLMLPVFAVLIVHAKCKDKTLKRRIPLAPVIGIGAVCATVFGYFYGMMQF